jgi:hypothetical protein
MVINPRISNKKKLSNKKKIFLTIFFTSISLFLSLNYSADRFNYINEFEKIINAPWGFLNTNGFFIVFFGSIFSFMDQYSVYVLYALFVNLLSSYTYTLLMIDKKADSKSWAFYIFFLMPLYSIQLKASLGLSFALLTFYNFKGFFYKFISLSSHYSLIFIYVIKQKFKIKYILFLSILTYYLYIYIGFKKIDAYRQIYLLTNKEDLFSWLNYKVLLVILLLLYSYFFQKKIKFIKDAQKIILIGLTTYYSFYMFPILAHRLSELCFAFVPFLFKKNNNNSMLHFLLLIITVFLGIYNILNNKLWLVQ